MYLKNVRARKNYPQSSRPLEIFPPIPLANHEHLRDIWTGGKRYVKCSQVVATNVPHREGLEVSSILKFTTKHFGILKFLPDYDYKKEQSRERLWSIANALINYKFQELINEKVNSREVKQIKSKDLECHALPDIIDIIKNSKEVSTNKGKSHLLLRPIIKNK